MKRAISVFLLCAAVCYSAADEQAATAVAPPDVVPSPPAPGAAPDIPVAPPITPPAPEFPGPCAYTPDVAARPVMRGFMSPARDMTEDDFDTLQTWGATLLRFQMVRNWHATGANQDLEEFDRWLDGRLDHFDLVNEPCHRGKALPDCDYWNLQRRAAEAVRAEDPHTPILVESQFWCSPEGFLTLVPFALTNVIYEVHVYSPGSLLATASPSSGTTAGTGRSTPSGNGPAGASNMKAKATPVSGGPPTIRASGRCSKG